MEIFISEIPEEGLTREGTLPPSIFDLSPNDSIRPTGAVTYKANIFHFDGVLTFDGHLKGEFQLECATCLEYFSYVADYPKWSSDVELEDDQISFDLVKLIREDFLLDLPPSPRCDELVEGLVCPKARYVIKIQKPLDEEAAHDTSDNAWDVLDDLKD
jgi:uncharacterized metal-binding protein YceD (DUF177 family)